MSALLITIITIAIVIGVIIFCFWLFDKYVASVIPVPWGRILEAVLAILVIVGLLIRFVGV